MPVRLASRYKFAAVAQARRPSLLLISDEIQQARLDLGAFGAYVAGKTPAPHHREWFKYLVTGQDSDCLRLVAGANLDILAPRGSAKSTWLAIYAAWVLGHNPHSQIIYAGYSESVALKQSRIIKRLVQSPRYQNVFPLVQVGDRKADRDWEINKTLAGVNSLDSDYSLYAIGLSGSITSRRSNLIIIDDPIKSSAAIANEDIREKLVINWHEVLFPTLIPGGRCVCIGTRFRRDDLHVTDFNTANGWQVLEQAAIVTGDDDAECSYWAQRFPVEGLQAIRDRSPRVFLLQYQNKLPPPDEDAIIRAEWLKYEAIPSAFDDVVLSIDLAASESERSDWTAIAVIGVKAGYFYVLEVVRFRAVGNLDKFDRLVDLYKKWHKGRRTRIIVERVGYQSSFAGDFKRYAHTKKLIHLTCDEFIPRGDKLQRLEGVSGIFANGYVIFNKHSPMQHVTDELLMVETQHDDCRDAVVQALSVLQKRARRGLTSA